MVERSIPKARRARASLRQAKDKTPLTGSDVSEGTLRASGVLYKEG
jgi:hypothetical protein